MPQDSFLLGCSVCKVVYFSNTHSSKLFPVDISLPDFNYKAHH